MSSRASTTMDWLDSFFRDVEDDEAETAAVFDLLGDASIDGDVRRRARVRPWGKKRERKESEGAGK